MAFQPIENYGIIGNLQTSALIGMDGSLDWYCFPRFDSPSLFGAILDDERGGFFQLCPTGETREESREGIHHRQVYWPDTNILVTRFLHPDGIAELTDFMPLGEQSDVPTGSQQKGQLVNRIIRKIECVRGSVRCRLVCKPAFDYGRQKHEVEISENGAAFKTEALSFCISTHVRLEKFADPAGLEGVRAEFTLKEGESLSVTLEGATDVVRTCEGEAKIEKTLQETIAYWHQWLSLCTYEGRWRQDVYRSALALKLMTFEPTGAIIAAPTASLPEVIGGSRNWDYRYTWIRDAAFTLYALLRIGFKSEAAGFMSWLQNHAHLDAKKEAPTVFKILGGSDLPEFALDHWKGYRDSKPVRIGNAASVQFQNDIYGELIDSLYLFNKYVQPISYNTWTKIRERMNWVCDNWMRPDEGIWEMRGEPQHFVYSKVMNWVALDRGIRLAEKRSLPSDCDRWIKVRDQIYEEVMTKGWNEKAQAFTQSYGSDNLDASVLIMPLVFFIAPNDERMLKTIDRINRKPKDGGLVSDGLVYRYTPGCDVDGLDGQEGTFNMCSFWLVEALTRAGKTEHKYLDQARLLFERVLRYGNHLGLFSEQTGLAGEALGNFPQAFTHLALISAAFNLDRELGRRAK